MPSDSWQDGVLVGDCVESLEAPVVCEQYNIVLEVRLLEQGRQLPLGRLDLVIRMLLREKVEQQGLQDLALV